MASIRDVAGAAGVSVATVSGVLNNAGNHSPATAARVRRVMQELGYVPRRNRLRRQENGAAPQQVGLLFPDVNIRAIHTPLAIGLIEGVQRVLAERNVHLSVLTLCPDGSLPSAVTEEELDGLIIRAGRTSESWREELGSISLPLVWTFGGSAVPANADVALVDNAGCGEWAAAKVPPDNRILVAMPPADNLEIEFRAVAFDFHLRQNDRATERVPCETLANAMAESPDTTLTVFMPGHDKEVFAAHELLSRRATEKGMADTLIAVMTEEVPLAPLPNGAIHVLHIDPVRIGMAAGRQVLSRRQNPWADPTRLLVPAKELQPCTGRPRACPPPDKETSP